MKIPTIRIPRWFPHLYIRVDVPLLSIDTALMHLDINMNEWIVVGVKVRLYRWRTEFALYKTKLDCRR